MALRKTSRPETSLTIDWAAKPRAPIRWVWKRRSVRSDVLFKPLFWPVPGWSGPSWQADLYYLWHIVPGRSVFFGALEAAVDDYGKGYFNAGAGYREYFPEQDRILGLWGWVDWDDTNSTGWLRFSGSAESLGKYLDVPRTGTSWQTREAARSPPGSPAARFFKVTTSI